MDLKMSAESSATVEISDKNDLICEKSFDLEELLVTDPLFADYFNVFLHLPTFPRSIHYDYSTGRFFICSKNTQQKVELNKVETINWLKSNRLSFFLDSDCYHEYRLAKLLSQAAASHLTNQNPESTSATPAVNLAPPPSTAVTSLPHTATPTALVVAAAPINTLPYKEEKNSAANLIGRYVLTSCNKTTNSAQVSEFEISSEGANRKYLNQSPSEFIGQEISTSNLVTRKNEVEVSGRVQFLQGNGMGGILPKHYHKTNNVVQSKTSTKFNIENDSDNPHTNSAESKELLEKELNSVSTHINVIVQSDSDNDESDNFNNRIKINNKVFHVGTLCVDYPDCILYEVCSDGKSSSKKPAAGKTAEPPTTTKTDSDAATDSELSKISIYGHFRLSKVSDLKRILRETSGEKLWCLWLDIERARCTLDHDDLINHLISMRQRYLNAGSRLRLASEQLDRWKLSHPNSWTLEYLSSIQISIVLPLLQYWVPRFIKQQESSSIPTDSAFYREFRSISNIHQMESYPTHPVPVSIPHRPKSCRPISSLTDSGFASSMNIYSASGESRANTSTSKPGHAVDSIREMSTLSDHVRSMRMVDIEGSFGSQVSGSVRKKQQSRTRQRPEQRSKQTDYSDDYNMTDTTSTLGTLSMAPSRKYTRLTLTSRNSTAAGGTTRPQSSSMAQTSSSFSHHVAPQVNRSRVGKKKGGVAEDKELIRDRRVREVDRLLKALESEGSSGKMFRKFIQRSNNKLWLNSLRFWESCQQYHSVFYSQALDVDLLNKNAKYIHSLYLSPTAPYPLDTPTLVIQEVERCLSPAYEDLFDRVEEQVIDTLLRAWGRATAEEAEAFDEMERLSLSRAEDQRLRGNRKNEYEQVTGLLKYDISIRMRAGLTDEVDQSEEGKDRKRRGQALTDKEKLATINFADFTLAKVLGWGEELEHFKKFLTENSGNIDLHCYLDIEAWKEAKGAETDFELANRAEDIKQLYLTERYFFGENSPAGKQGQIKELAAGGSLGRLEDLRPTELCLLEAQRYVQQRLEYEWLPLFLRSQQFQQRQLKRQLDHLTRPSSSLSQLMDDVMQHQKSGKGQEGSSKHLGRKYQPSQEKVLALRKALMDPVISAQFSRYLSIRAGNLENNVYFWQEVQKYKDISHVHSDKALLQQKLSAVIRRFIESHIPPAIQIGIDQEMADKILSARHQPTPYIFREAQAKVFLDMLPWWDEFLSYKEKKKRDLTEEDLLLHLEKRKRRVKLAELKKARQLEEAALKERANRKQLQSELFPNSIADNQDGRTSAASSLAALSMLRPYYWTYSEYLRALKKEAELNNQRRQSGINESLEDDSIQSDEESVIMIDMKSMTNRSATKRSNSSQRTTSIASGDRFNDEWSRKASIISKKSLMDAKAPVKSFRRRPTMKQLTA